MSEVDGKGKVVSTLKTDLDVRAKIFSTTSAT